MSPKYRVLLAVLLSLLAFYSQVVFGQTKVTTKIVHIDGNSIVVKLDNLNNKDCNTGPGAISISASGGSGPFLYSWSGPNNFKSSQEDISNLQEGTYSLSVTDAKGCSLARSWNVQSVCSATCSLDDVSTITNVTGCSASNGSVSVTITGGSGNYSYTWYNSNFQIIGNTKNLTAVQAGDYYVEVTDLNKPTCAAMFFYTVESSFKLNAVINPNTNCVAPFSGSINTSITGGSGNYTYVWKRSDGTTIPGTTSITGLGTGNYQLQVKDNVLGCEVNKYLFVYNSPSAVLTINELITPATTCSPANGAIDISVGSGSGNFSYTWFNQTAQSAAGTSQDLSQASPGTYSIYVLDNLSKCSAYKVLTVSNLSTPAQFSASVVDNTQCSAPFNGAISLDLVNASDYQVLWTDGTTVHNQKDLTSIAPGRYGLSLTNIITGCVTAISRESNQALVVNDNLNESLSIAVDKVIPKTNCGSPDGSVQITVQSNALYTLSWTGPNGFTSDSEDLAGLDSGTYVLTATVTCNEAPVILKTDLTTQTNSTLSLNLLDIVSDPDNNLDPQSFEILGQPSSGALASITSDNILQIQYRNSFKGKDNVRLRACDILDACSENSLTIEVDVNSSVIVYNAVAPTSTGDNKFMRIEHLEGDNHVSIFNRWGDKVFDVRNYENEIPGKRFEGLSNAGKALPTGTYFYKIEFDKSSETVTGYLSLKQ